MVEDVIVLLVGILHVVIPVSLSLQISIIAEPVGMSAGRIKYAMAESVNALVARHYVVTNAWISLLTLIIAVPVGGHVQPNRRILATIISGERL
jgi:hypothetical protein